MLGDKSVSSLFETALKIGSAQRISSGDDDIVFPTQEDMDILEPLDEAQDEQEDYEMAVEDVAETAEGMDVNGENDHPPQNAYQMHAIVRSRKADAVNAIRQSHEIIFESSKTSTLDVNKLIMSCLHGAAAMLKNAHNDGAASNRKTHRLQLLMNLLEDGIKIEGLQITYGDVLFCTARERYIIKFKFQNNYSIYISYLLR